MNPRWEAATQGLVKDLQRVFAARLLSVVVYGQGLDEQTRTTLPSFVLVSNLLMEDLDACAGLASRWARDGIETPLILPEAEFRRSLDAFPLEYRDILAAHIRVFGTDPFDGLTFDNEDLRRACERQAKSHLLHLREGYLEAHGDPRAVAQLVSASTPPFAALLRSVAQLTGVTAPTRAEAAVAGAHTLGLNDTIVSQVLSLTGPSAKTADGARLFPDYLSAVEQLARAVDAWRPGTA